MLEIHTSTQSWKILRRVIFMGLALSMTASCGDAATPNEDTQKHLENPMLGTYEVVTRRNASDVASMAANPFESDSPIGKTFIFTSDGLEMEGLGCDAWEIKLVDDRAVNSRDPMLADIYIAPANGPRDAGGPLNMTNYTYSCEGEHFISVLKVDTRVAVVPWANGTQYLILEKPLTQQELSRLQVQLKSMKFYSGAASGEFDEATRQAVKAWADYRKSDPEGYAFYRPAITDNLLEGLNIFTPEETP